MNERRGRDIGDYDESMSLGLSLILPDLTARQYCNGLSTRFVPFMSNSYDVSDSDERIRSGSISKLRACV